MGIASVKYGFFWEPPQSVASFIESWKGKVRSVEPEAAYLNHPVHSTFFLLMAEPRSESDIVSSLKFLSQGIHPFTVKFSGWHIFYADTATGGDTLTIGITPSETLYCLQEKIATTMAKYRSEAVVYPVNWQGVYLQSIQKWGFPFVGKHWVPHISIASVKTEGKKIVSEAKESKDQPHIAQITNVSLYRIMENLHTHIHTVKLK